MNIKRLQRYCMQPWENKGLARGTTLLGSATTIVYVDERNKTIISIRMMITLMEVLASIFASYKRHE